MSRYYDENTEYSLRPDKQHVVDLFYRTYFLYKNGKFTKEIEIVTDEKRQVAGIDKIIYFTDGTQWRIDEKIRKYNYPDCLLEYDQNGGVGWTLDRKKTTDIISYVNNKIYLINYKGLRERFEENGDIWKEKYDCKPTLCDSNTWNISVPWSELDGLYVCDNIKYFDLEKEEKEHEEKRRKEMLKLFNNKKELS